MGTLARRSSASLAWGQQGSGKADRAAPLCAICYNKKMLGTDKCDQMRDIFTAAPVEQALEIFIHLDLRCRMRESLGVMG